MAHFLIIVLLSALEYHVNLTSKLVLGFLEFALVHWHGSLVITDYKREWNGDETGTEEEDQEELSEESHGSNCIGWESQLWIQSHLFDLM